MGAVPGDLLLTVARWCLAFGYLCVLTVIVMGGIAPSAKRGCVGRHSLSPSATGHLFAGLLHIPEAADHHAHGFASKKENPLV